MKKLKTCLAFFICCILSLNMVICNVKADNNVVLSNKAYLLKTGMPQKEIEKLDDDVMQFIVDDLKSGGKHFEYINSNIENQISILSSETLTGISLLHQLLKMHQPFISIQHTSLLLINNLAEKTVFLFN